MVSSVRRTTEAVITALLYFVLGAAGLSIAVAPGYASPVFPAAGLAVAAMLWSQGRALPGVWLGSFSLNLALAWFNGNLSAQAAQVAFGISLGSTLQAWLAWSWVRRRVSDAWRQCENESTVFQMLLFAGPLACLASATVGVSVLLGYGVIPGSAFWDSWWNWWSGDTFGVLVMLPLSLSLFLVDDRLWRSRLIKVSLPMVMALVLVTVAYLTVSRWEQDQIHGAVSEVGQVVTQSLQTRVNAHEESLAALRRLVAVNPKLSYEDFAYFTEITLRDNPDVFALSINPYVLSAKRAAFERDYASRLQEADFQIRDRAQGQLGRAQDRAAYVPVGYIAPLKGNRPALGFDIYSEARRRQAIDEAVARRGPSVTSPIQLVQEQKKRSGFLLMQPIFDDERAGQGSSPISALVVGVFKADEMIEIAARAIKDTGVHIRVVDSNAPPDTPVLFSSDKEADIAREDFTYTSEVTVANRLWRLEAMPTAQFVSERSRWLGYAVGVVGLALATMIQILLLGITGRTAVVERRVREQTAELNAKSTVLAQRNAQLDTVFTLSPDGLVTFNEHGKLEFANPAFLTIWGWDAADVQEMDLSTFEARLKDSCLDEAACLSSSIQDADAAHKNVVRLKGTDQRVVEIKVRKPDSQSRALTMYFRDITYEAEVDRLKSEFLAHAAHELRTPMTSVHGFSELLLQADLDEQTRRESLETIHRHSESLMRIISELLDLARIEAGGATSLEMETVDLGAIVQQVCSDLGFDKKRWPLQIADTAHPVLIHADRQRLRQVFINILGNAQKYSPQGGAIAVNFVQSDTHVGVEVRDHGMGLTPRHLERIGQRFWRADKSGSIAGSGLGVAIVKEIMAMHGGHLQIESTHGEGSVFTLWFPKVPATPA